MNDGLPTGKLKRALSGGHTAAKVGGKVLAYYAKRPFLSDTHRSAAHERMSRKSAQALFQGLSLLKGTALKMAQQLSLEMDILPEAACRELSKSCHQVPPINRALARSVIQRGLGRLPEALFQSFDPAAFAAASLGQVHRATDFDNRRLAVKIQYPGIARTIESDVTLLRHLLRPVIQSDQLLPTLREIADRLREEVDYEGEADNLTFFNRSMNIEGVCIPEAVSELSCPTVLTTTYMPGRPLDDWLRSGPDQQERDLVARRLQEIFICGLYKLHTIHSDPNPGNFVIADDLTVNLVDFGCIKRLDAGFVELYRLLSQSAAHLQYADHYQNMMKIGFFSPDLPDSVLKKLEATANDFCRWFGRLFAADDFDFGKNADFISEGKAIMGQLQEHRRYLQVNPDFIFLDRTRYGLLRLYERMGARVAFRNEFEW